MGNALVVMVVPEEMLMHPRGAEHGRSPRAARGQSAAAPAPSYELPVPRSAVWVPAREPRGLDWHKDPKKRSRQTARNRRSLERFLNQALGELDGMVRSGWWIMGRARVRVSDMRGVPPGKSMAEALVACGPAAPAPRKRRRR